MMYINKTGAKLFFIALALCTAHSPSLFAMQNENQSVYDTAVLLNKELSEAHTHQEMLPFITKRLKWKKAEQKAEILTQCLYWALKGNDFFRAEFLLKNGAKSNALSPHVYPGRTHVTLLMEFALNGTAEQVEYLLDKGADINAQDSLGCLAKLYSISNPNQQQARAMLAPLQGGCITDAPSLFKAIDLQKYLLVSQALTYCTEDGCKNGIDPNCKNSNKETPLDCAVVIRSKNPTPENYLILKAIYCAGGENSSVVLSDYLSPEEINKLENAKAQFMPHHQKDYEHIADQYSRGAREGKLFQDFYKEKLDAYAGHPLSVPLISLITEQSGNIADNAQEDFLHYSNYYDDINDKIKQQQLQNRERAQAASCECRCVIQ